MDDKEHANRSEHDNLECHSSTESYESAHEEQQTTHWYEVQIIGSGGFGNVTLWRNKVSCAHVYTLLHVNE